MNRVIKKLGINNIHNRGIRGKGITVAVLDSGISRHLDFDTDFYEYDLECLLNNALYGKHLSDTNFLTLLICLSILNN